MRREEQNVLACCVSSLPRVMTHRTRRSHAQLVRRLQFLLPGWRVGGLMKGNGNTEINHEISHSEATRRSLVLLCNLVRQGEGEAHIPVDDLRTGPAYHHLPTYFVLPSIILCTAQS